MEDLTKHMASSCVFDRIFDEVDVSDPTLLLEWCDTITLVPDDELDAISGILLGGGAGQQSLS